jgi:hypothetical protein
LPIATLARLGLVLSIGAGALIGCSAGGHPPVARLTLTPPYVPVGDHYQTAIVLDGSQSKDELDDPAGSFPLRFGFATDDPAPQLTPDGAKATLRIAGDRPTAVSLTVTDADGLPTTVQKRIGVTLPD